MCPKNAKSFYAHWNKNSKPSEIEGKKIRRINLA
jgi:hypothetical protein